MKRAFTLIELVVVLAIVFILAAILFPVFQRGHGDNARLASCQSNLKQIGLGMLQYAQDYDERLPCIASNSVASSTRPFQHPYGWADGIQPYIKSLGVLQCPTQGIGKPTLEATQPGFTDYYFNTNLDKRQQKLIADPANTFLCGEGNDGHDGSDARYNRNAISQAWLDTEKSPVRRHLDASNFLFADGHVKAFGFEKIFEHSRHF